MHIKFLLQLTHIAKWLLFFSQNIKRKPFPQRACLSVYIILIQRWVYTFRKRLVNIRVNTTNGLERQNREFKDGFLKVCNPGKSLLGMIDTLITKFLPASKDRFVYIYMFRVYLSLHH